MWQEDVIRGRVMGTYCTEILGTDLYGVGGQCKSSWERRTYGVFTGHENGVRGSKRQVDVTLDCIGQGDRS